jgi:hypothetical protein
VTAPDALLERLLERVADLETRERSLAADLRELAGRLEDLERLRVLLDEVRHNLEALRYETRR